MQNHVFRQNEKNSIFPPNENHGFLPKMQNHVFPPKMQKFVFPPKCKRLNLRISIIISSQKYFSKVFAYISIIFFFFLIYLEFAYGYEVYKQCKSKKFPYISKVSFMENTQYIRLVNKIPKEVDVLIMCPINQVIQISNENNNSSK